MSTDDKNGVQDKLNLLNTSSRDINRLENEIEEARTKYQSMFHDASRKIESTGKGIKNSIQRARQFYHLKEAAVQAQSEALRAARQFQSANGIYRAAKETITLAEQKLMEDQSAAILSSEWQEMLNQATIRVMDAEREKTRAEEEHMKRSNFFASLEGKLQFLEKRFKKSIAKSRTYFEVKYQLELQLKQQKQNIDDLQNAIKSSKKQYSESLRHLEGISDQIHESRRQKILLMYPREPGVGADNESLASTTSDPIIDRGFLKSSSVGYNSDSDNEDEAEGDDVFTSESEAAASAHAAPSVPDSSATVTSPLDCSATVTSPLDSARMSVQAGQGNDTSNSEKDTNSDLHNTDIPKPEVAAQIVNDTGGSMDVDSSNDVTASASKSDVRECGSGSEEHVVCVDAVSELSRESVVSGSDARLPSRDENPTEGSSDPEEFTKDLQIAKTVSDVEESSQLQSTSIL